MNLSFSRDDPKNTMIMMPDGRPLYVVETPAQFLGTANTKVMNVSGKPSDVGMIEWHSWSDSVLLVGRRRVVPVGGGIFSSAQTFQGVDGRMYKWKIESRTALLVDARTNALVAMFRESKSGWFSAAAPASLDITPQGMSILDDIITTFVWFEAKRRQKNRSGQNAAVIGAISS